MLAMSGSATPAATVVLLQRPVHVQMEGRFCCLWKLRKEIGMRLFSFVFAARFWVLAWLVILFVGLTPLPPEIELVIVTAFLAHVFWFAHRRFRRAALASAIARAERAEEAEYRRLRRTRPPQSDGLPTVGPVTWH